MSTVTLFLRSALLLVGLFVGATALQAQDAPGTPVEFAAKLIETNEGVSVKLMWMANRTGGVPTHFDIYIAEGETDNLDEFQLLDTLESENSSNGMFYYQTRTLEPGVYSFYIVARNQGGSSERSVIKVVEIKEREPKPENGIWIVSKRVAETEPGEPWEWEVEIEKKGEFTSITYSLDNEPDGMVIDEETGVISWESPTEGRHVFLIKVTATLANGETITVKQEFVLEVGDDDEPNKPCAEVTGTVKSENGDVIMEAIVTAWMIKEGDNNNDDWHAVQKAYTRQGTYVMPLQPGTYKIRVEGPGIVAEWYENAAELVDAKDVVVTCENPRSVVDFIVEKKPEPKTFVVTGQVYDAETNGGLHNALVIFSPRKTENRADYYQREVKAETNHDGYYEAKLIEGVTYVAMCIARPSNTVKSEYIPEWYNNTHDATEATSITLTANMDGVDFPMDKRETYDNGFGGKLVDNESGEGIPGKVVAYQLTNKEGREEGKRHVESVATDDQGNYTFTNLEPGTYIVFGVPIERPWVPGWYVAGEAAAESWKDATRIDVGEVMLTVQHDIRLVQAEKENGRGRVRGHCYDNRGGVVAKGDGGVQAAIPVAGALVIAKDAAGVIVDFALANEAGEFSLEELGIGNITVTADRIGYDESTSVLSITDQQLDVVTSFGMNPVVSSVEVPTDLVGTTYHLFPNPATSAATLSFPASGAATVHVVDMTGTIISTQSVQANGGTATLHIEAATFPAGMLMIHVNNGTASFALPLHIVR